MNRSTPLLVAALFFLSGACTLVYQVVWVRMLIVLFGVSVFAVSTVLTAFMAGLALGSALFGRVADSRGRGLRIYALLELGIGLYSLAFPWILTGLDDLHTALYRLLEGQPLLFALARFALSFLILLAPTTLMGGTLPALCRFAVRHLSAAGWQLGSLYSINTAGAALGCFAAAFFLMEHLGVRGTVFAAAAANLAIAAAALLVERASGTWSQPPEPDAPEPVSSAEPLPRRLETAVPWLFALSGFAALGYEVVWTRLLQTTLTSATVQTLSTIIITFLVGIAAGSAAAARWADRLRDRVYAFGGRRAPPRGFRRRFHIRHRQPSQADTCLPEAGLGSPHRHAVHRRGRGDVRPDVPDGVPVSPRRQDPGAAARRGRDRGRRHLRRQHRRCDLRRLRRRLRAHSLARHPGLAGVPGAGQSRRRSAAGPVERRGPAPEAGAPGPGGGVLRAVEGRDSREPHREDAGMEPPQHTHGPLRRRRRGNGQRPRRGKRLPHSHGQRRGRGADGLFIHPDLPPPRNPADGRSPGPGRGSRYRLRGRHHPGHGGGVRSPPHRLCRGGARGRKGRELLRRPQQQGPRAASDRGFSS